VIAQTAQASSKPPEFRGAALQIQTLIAPEWIISGPSETGKTFAALTRLDQLARKYPKSQLAIIRKVRHDMDGTVLQTYEKKVMRPDVDIYGGSKPERYTYPNESVIWVGGMDRPGSALSGERDAIYINQAEELALEDWETCTTRTTGRAGNFPLGESMTFGDCNPSYAAHWIKSRESLRLLHSQHEDNPSLFQDGKLTPQGILTMATLDRLTGVRYSRLRKGLWVSAEGTVYEFDPAIHEVDWFAPSKDARLMRTIDFGFVNPFTCQWWYIDHDNRMYLYREIYMTKRTVKVHADTMKRVESGLPLDAWAELNDAQKKEAWERSPEKFEVTITDHDAEDRATLEENGIYTTAADKDISTGIEKVQERLKVQGDGKARLFVMRGALVERDEELARDRKPLCLRDEFDVYMWPKAQDGKPIKDVPVKMNDHAQDPTRYGAKYLDGLAGWTISGVF